MPNYIVPKEAQLWAELYALMCQSPSVHWGLAHMLPGDQEKLDDMAEAIIRRYLEMDTKH